MPIGIDIRPLQDPVSRGVSSYARPLLEAMIKLQGAAAFKFFAAGRRPLSPTLSPLGGRENIKHLRVPSKIVNAGMRWLGSPTLDGQLGTPNIFMPNLNFWSVGLDAKLTVTVHDLSFLVDPTWYSPRGRAWHALANATGLIRRADQIITLSEHTKTELVELMDIDEKRIHHIRPGLPAILSADERPCEFPYILFLGVLEKRKNIAGALRAFELFAQKNKDVHFVLAGPQSTTYHLQPTTSSRVHLLGAVSEAKKAALLRHATALFLPSFYEGFGFPPLEAMSVGVPVVASTAGALPETVGNAGILLDPIDLGGFADALAEICASNDLRQTLIARGYEQIKPFSWNQCARETLKVINQNDQAFSTPIA